MKILQPEEVKVGMTISLNGTVCICEELLCSSTGEITGFYVNETFTDYNNDYISYFSVRLDKHSIKIIYPECQEDLTLLELGLIL